MASFIKVWDEAYMVGGPGLTSMEDCCVYVMQAPSGNIALIDSGLGFSYNSIVENILEAGLAPKKLKFAIATHAHIDHVGALSKFRRDYGPTVVAHSVDADAIERGDSKRLALDLYGVSFEPCPVDAKLSREEEVLDLHGLELHVIHTPGHTEGSVSIWTEMEGLRLLFAQDIHGPFNPEWGSSLDSWRRSMEKLLELDADILLEGHFGVIQPSGAARRFIEDYINIIQPHVT